MEILSELFKQHRTILLVIMAVQWLVQWLAHNKATKLIGAIPMPTKDSSPREIWWFKFLNNLVGNDKRAEMPPLEASPNFLPAVNKKLAEVGRAPIPEPEPVPVKSDVPPQS